MKWDGLFDLSDLSDLPDTGNLPTRTSHVCMILRVFALLVTYMNWLYIRVKRTRMYY